MRTTVCIFALAAVLPLGCATSDIRKPQSSGSIEQLRATWINRNGNIGTNVAIRVRRYQVDTSTASIHFYLDESDLRHPCSGSAEYRLPIERLVSSNVTPDFCPPQQSVWELIIDTSP